MANTTTTNAVENFLSGCNCAQAIVKAFSDYSETETDILLKLAQPFGGGIVRSGNLCGAVSGALMSIGLKYTNLADPESKAMVVTLGNKFLTEFSNQNKSIYCKDLLGEDISTDEGHTAIKELGLRDKICKNLIFSSSEILNRILLENKAAL